MPALPLAQAHPLFACATVGTQDWDGHHPYSEVWFEQSNSASGCSSARRLSVFASMRHGARASAVARDTEELWPSMWIAWQACEPYLMPLMAEFWRGKGLERWQHARRMHGVASCAPHVFSCSPACRECIHTVACHGGCRCFGNALAGRCTRLPPCCDLAATKSPESLCSSREHALTVVQLHQGAASPPPAKTQR